MQIDGWKYYNHAAIPTTAPHETPDILPIKNGNIWKIEGGTPLLARWTSEFDCGFETNWWYLIKEAPFNMLLLSAKEQKSIRQSLRKNEVKKIWMMDYIDSLYACYVSAFDRYLNANSPMDKEAFASYCHSCDTQYECWGSFNIDDGELIGYMTVKVHERFAEILTAKFDCRYLKRQASDALYYHILDYYLNNQKLKYVSSGERCINHKTGTQDYKIKRFGYRKAYCNLHLMYNPKIKWLIKILYPFRRIMAILDKIRLFHLINSVLLMESIVRENT